jgi:ABC-2 type transport system ATP-binding protein
MAGRIVAEGTPIQLKQQIAGDVLTLRLEEQSDVALQRAQELLRSCPNVRDIRGEQEGLQVYVEQGEESLVKILRLLEEAQIGVISVVLARPSLDDVFLRQTGRSLRDQQGDSGVMKMYRQGRKLS